MNTEQFDQAVAEDTVVELSQPSKDAPMMVHVTVGDVNNHLDVLKLLRAFQALSYPSTCRHAVNVTPVHNDWISCHYDVKMHVLHVHYHGSYDVVPRLSWAATETQLRRTVLENGHARSKVWSPYRDNGFQETWLVTYNDHSRQPLHMRKASIPATANQLISELGNQFRSNTKLTTAEREMLENAIYSWKCVPQIGQERLFTREECDRIWNKCAVMQHAHHIGNVTVLMEAFEALDFLTLPGEKTLTELVNNYIAATQTHK